MTLERMILLAAAANVAIIAGVAYTHAHEAPSGWQYDSWCCNTRDCAKIPASAVRAGRFGYEVVLQPGEHPMVPDGYAFVVPYTATEGGRAQLRISQDGDYHACILPANSIRKEPEPRCFYAPPPGS
jgi:hypothetical protein